jgi:hypothetical protein
MIITYLYFTLQERNAQRPPATMSVGGGKMDEKMKLQDRVIDLVEENKGKPAHHLAVLHLPPPLGLYPHAHALALGLAQS